MNQPDPREAPGANAPKAEPVNQGRRRLSKVALATPVVASLAARPALACSVSGFMSGNTSPGHKDPRCEGYGCTPGFWKNNPEVWALRTSYSAGTCKKANPSGNCQEWEIGGTKLGDILTCANPFTQVSSSDYLLAIFTKGLDNGGNPTTDYADVCHYIAAILNAAASEASYGSSVAEVQAALCKAVTEGKVNYFTTTLLAGLNERGCMFDAHGNCETNFVLSGGTCIPACPTGQSWDATTMSCKVITP
ncbi:MAG: hypothetical protein AB1831_01960 [Pseudomonadota bacterium]